LGYRRDSHRANSRWDLLRQRRPPQNRLHSRRHHHGSEHPADDDSNTPSAIFTPSTLTYLRTGNLRAARSFCSATPRSKDAAPWRMHYARTTRLWHDRLLANRVAAEREVGAMKARLWLMYLAGVSIGFDRARVGVFQTLASKRKRGVSGVPLSRADLYG
jgi:cyclopropane fatty-acyl-phospholipid synthase-like methyltransferase